MKKLPDYIEPVPEPTLIIDNPAAANAAAAAFALVKKSIDIKPGEMWPDGKIRPHMVKTKKGEKVWLTDDEFDQLKTAARHRYYANPRAEKSTPDRGFEANQSIRIRHPDGAYHEGLAIRVKVDGSMRVSAVGLSAGQLVKVRRVDSGPYDMWWDYIVTSAWHRGARLRPIYS